jgi:hypothetical protein
VVPIDHLFLLYLYHDLLVLHDRLYHHDLRLCSSFA